MYYNAAGGGPSHRHRQHAQKISLSSAVWFLRYVCEQTDTQTDRRTRLSQYPGRTHTGTEFKKGSRTNLSGQS